MFFKKKERYLLCKVFQVSINGLNLKSSIYCLFESSDIKVASFLDSFEINFGSRQYKSWDRCKEALNKLNTNVIHLSSSSLNNRSYVMAFIKKSPNPEHYGVLDIEFAVPEELLTKSQISSFLRKLFIVMPFDYGYITILDTSYDFFLETKMKNNIFGQEVNISDRNIVWQEHIIGVKYGYIRDVYDFNLLNASHLEQPKIAELISSGVGKVSSLNQYIYIWVLNEEEQKYATSFLSKSKYIIANTHNPSLFTESDDAARFRVLMS